MDRGNADKKYNKEYHGLAIELKVIQNYWNIVCSWMIWPLSLLLIHCPELPPISQITLVYPNRTVLNGYYNHRPHNNYSQVKLIGRTQLQHSVWRYGEGKTIFLRVLESSHCADKPLVKTFLAYILAYSKCDLHEQKYKNLIQNRVGCCAISKSFCSFPLAILS